MKQVLIVIVIALLTVNLKAQRAFPGAKGYGAYTRGAYSGSASPKILIVDNLSSGETGNEATGRGSFLWCLTRNYPRIVLFEVSGTIDYRNRDSEIIIKSGYLTVAGQTAPGKGITLRGTNLTFDYQHSDPSIAANNVIFQHIRIRAGDDTTGSPANTRDCMNVRTSDVIIDHCSFSWSIDEVFGIGEGSNITVSNCLFYEPLHYSLHHREGGDNRPQAHGFGMILYPVQKLSMVKNLIAHSVQRNPLSHAKSIVMLNNMMYNPGCRVGIYVESADGDPLDLWYQGNVVLDTRDPECSSSVYSAIITSNVPDNSKLYFYDNICRLSLNNPSLNEWDKVKNENPNIEPESSSPLTDAYYNILESSEVEDYIMENVGAFYFKRDASDARVLRNVENRTGEYINSPDSLPARIYNFDESETYTNNGNFINGFDWSSSPSSFTINGTIINLNRNCTNFNEVYSHISPQLPEGVEAYKVYGGYYMGFKTIKKGSNQSITVSGPGLVDFGIPEGTFTGSDGVGGYPVIYELHRPLTDIEGYPVDNPHGLDTGNGYTNLENWLYDSWDYTDPPDTTIVTSLINHTGVHERNTGIFSLQPNPSTGTFILNLKSYQDYSFPLKLMIYNTTGKLEEEISGIQQIPYFANLKLNGNMYLVSLVDAENRIIGSEMLMVHEIE